VDLLKELNQKESEMYELKIKSIQKDNELLSLNQKVSSLERQVITLRHERDKLIEISNNLRG